MTRRSLRPQLNQIRAWVTQGRTDAWIAHQLEVTVQQVESFKSQHSLKVDGEESPPETVDLRAEDDSAIAKELEEAERAAEERRAEEARKAQEQQKEQEQRKAQAAAEEESEPSTDDEGKKLRRRRGSRRRRRSSVKSFEGTFDHGEEGYGLWLDPAVADNATYAEYWAGHRPVEVTIEEDQIIIRRAENPGAEAAID